MIYFIIVNFRNDFKFFTGNCFRKHDTISSIQVIFTNKQGYYSFFFWEFHNSVSGQKGETKQFQVLVMFPNLHGSVRMFTQKRCKWFLPCNVARFLQLCERAMYQLPETKLKIVVAKNKHCTLTNWPWSTNYL